MIERYILRQAFWPLVASVGVLGFLALLTQSVSTLDLIIDQRQSLFTYLQITALAMPQLIALILPLALFVATVYAVNRLQNDSELVVCSAAGMSKRALASPMLKIAMGALIVNLAINLWVQPYSFREMRERLYEVRGDLAARLVRPGQFRSATEGLTIYARDIERGGTLTDLLIEDASDPENVVTYMARSGVFTEVAGEPTMVMYDGSRQAIDAQNQLSYLRFDRWPVELNAFLESEGELSYKLSDRYVDQLFFPLPEDEWGMRYRDRLYAEGNYRLASPLYAPALVLIALAAVLGGQHSRTGYNARIAVAAATALVVRMIGFAVESACADNLYLNPLQYVVPLVAAFFAARALFTNAAKKAERKKRPPRRRPDTGASTAPAPA
ncbi:MAG: LPS export ABC transporter permease LptF [Maricaulaceae bacterium]